jgi:hypothetical protein
MPFLDGGGGFFTVRGKLLWGNEFDVRRWAELQSFREGNDRGWAFWHSGIGEMPQVVL